MDKYRKEFYKLLAHVDFEESDKQLDVGARFLGHIWAWGIGS